VEKYRLCDYESTGNSEGKTMVSSYLICDLCGGFGPPASFLNENGLRLCYQCWYRERLSDDSSVVDPEAEAPTESASTGFTPLGQSRNSS
jgi:hypothetical protein